MPDSPTSNQKSNMPPPPPAPTISIVLNEPSLTEVPKIQFQGNNTLLTKDTSVKQQQTNSTTGSSLLGNDLSTPVRSEFRLQKTSLAPDERGRPMIDWIRKQRTFQNERDDMTSEIGPDELKLHNTRNDCWIALRGRVYNITSYVRFHPGGVPEIMKGAGIDGTALFNSIHRYVNFEQILKGKQVGIYVPDKVGIRDNVKVTNSTELIVLDTNTSSSPAKNNSDNELPTTKFSEDNGTVYYKVEMKGIRSSEDNWTAGIIAHEFLVLKVFTTPPEMWIAQFKLREKLLQDRIELTFSKCAKKGCIKFSKPRALEWKTIGESQSPSNVIEDSRRTIDNMHDCRIVKRKEIAHNMYYFIIEVPQSARIGVPIGSDVKFCVEESRRKYTPICPLFSNPNNSTFNSTHQQLHFIIKIYENGELTPKLRDLPIDEPDTLQIGNPASVFNTDFLHGSKSYFLFAGGSGITPYFRIIEYYIEHNVALGVNHIVLLYWSKEEKEIIYKADFENLAKKTPWFYFYPILTQEKSTEWKGQRGRISADLMNSLFTQLKFTDKNKKSTRFLTCGTDGFNLAVSDTLENLGFSSEDIFIFLG